MALEEIFVDRDILERDDPLSRLELDDGVDEERGKAVTDAFEYIHLRALRDGG
jgi:hypothetical protein